MPTPTFIDYYEMMQISSRAEAETIQRVYRMLAARYHPDNAETGDRDKFILLNQAYEVLSDPTLRSNYDFEYQMRRMEPLGVFEMKEFAAGIDGEANRRLGILCLLYHRRRTNPEHPGMSILDLESLMSFPREHLMFTIWYLRDMQLLIQEDNSDYSITSKGVNHVEQNLPSHRVLYNLLKAGESGSMRAAADPRSMSADRSGEEA